MDINPSPSPIILPHQTHNIVFSSTLRTSNNLSIHTTYFYHHIFSAPKTAHPPHQSAQYAPQASLTPHHCLLLSTSVLPDFALPTGDDEQRLEVHAVGGYEETRATTSAGPGRRLWGSGRKPEGDERKIGHGSESGRSQENIANIRTIHLFSAVIITSLTVPHPGDQDDPNPPFPDANNGQPPRSRSPPCGKYPVHAHLLTLLNLPGTGTGHQAPVGLDHQGRAQQLQARCQRSRKQRGGREG